MLARSFLYAFALFSILFLGNAARDPAKLLARIQEIRLQDQAKGFSILESGSLIRFTPEAEYKFPLWAVVERSQSKRFSDELLRYLYERGGTSVSVWELPSHLRLQAIYHSDTLIRDRQFTVRNIINDQGFGAFEILAENDDFYFAYAFEDGTIFYKEEKYGTHHFGCGLHRYVYFDPNSILLEQSVTTFLLCGPNKNVPTPPPLITTLDQASPDLSTEFLRILANPDPTIY